MVKSCGNIIFLLDVYLDVLFPQYFEEGGQQGLELAAIDGLVSVDVQKIEKVLNVVSGGLLASN
jgi:hypothetical protein